MSARRALAAVHILLIAAAALLCARTVTHTVALVLLGRPPAPSSTAAPARARAPTPPAARDFQAASGANIFGATRSGGHDDDEGGDGGDGGDAAAPSSPGACDEAPPTALPLRLKGTVVSALAELSAASIDDVSSRATGADMYSVDERVAGVAVVRAIAPESVCLWNTVSSRLETLALDAPPAPVAPVSPPPAAASDDVRQTGPGHFEIRQGAFGPALADPSSLARDVRFAPFFEGGKAAGFKLVYARPGSAFSVLGLARGDVVKRVNGYEIATLTDALGLLTTLKDEAHFSVDVVRAGAPVTIDANVVP